MMQTHRIALASAVLALAAGCSGFGSKSTDYKGTAVAQPLEVPPELTAPSMEDRYAIGTDRLKVYSHRLCCIATIPLEGASSILLVGGKVAVGSHHSIFFCDHLNPRRPQMEEMDLQLQHTVVRLARPFGALLFGLMRALSFIGQEQGWSLPAPVLNFLPYVVTLLLIAAPAVFKRFRRATTPPAALATPYFREQR